MGNTHPTRDLSFVANTVEGFVLAASTPGAIGHTINLGSGVEISIGELAETTLARTVLSWTPIVTLKNGLERTLAWMQASPKRFRDCVYAV